MEKEIKYLCTTCLPKYNYTTDDKDSHSLKCDDCGRESFCIGVILSRESGDEKPKYGIGDSVKIINYGHLMWANKNHPQPDFSSIPIYKETDNVIWYDINKIIVGQEGIIDGVTNTQNRPKYSIYGIPDKHAWYDEEQLELVCKNNANEH